MANLAVQGAAVSSPPTLALWRLGQPPINDTGLRAVRTSKISSFLLAGGLETATPWAIGLRPSFRRRNLSLDWVSNARSA